MSKIAYLSERDLVNYSNLKDLEVLETDEDVATLLDVFEETVKEVSYKNLVKVVKDSENYYYFVVGSGVGGFDLFSFINSHFNSPMRVSCVNARLAFPSELSRGIYDDSTSGYDEDDEPATSYLDEEDSLLNRGVNRLYYKKTNTYIDIPNSGLHIGRSVKRADFIIRGNNNIGRVHCKVYVANDGRLMVHDFSSLNGTFVNGIRVNSKNDVVLKDGDLLVLANEEFKIL